MNNRLSMAKPASECRKGAILMVFQVCPLCNYGRPLHPSKDWKVFACNFILLPLDTNNSIYLSENNLGYRFSLGVRCLHTAENESQPASKAIISYFEHFKNGKPGYGSARLIKLCCSFTLSWKQCFSSLKEINQSCCSLARPGVTFL